METEHIPQSNDLHYAVIGYVFKSFMMDSGLHYVKWNT